MQRQFVDYYIGVSNCCKMDAARRAGYEFPDRQGWRLYQDPRIKEAIRERMEALAMPAEEVLARLSLIARNPLAALLKEVKLRSEQELIQRREAAGEGEASEIREGGFIPGEWGIDLETAQEMGFLPTIKRFGYDAQGRTKLETLDPVRALELLGNRLGLFNKTRVELTGEDGGPVQFALKPDLSKLSDEELEQLERLLNKTAVPDGDPG